MDAVNWNSVSVYTECEGGDLFVQSIDYWVHFFFQFRQVILGLAFNMLSALIDKHLHVLRVAEVDRLDLVVDWHCWALAIEVVCLLFKFNLILPVFTIQGNHEILEIMEYVVVLRHVLLVHVLVTGHILDLKVGLEEAVECFLLV